MNKISPHSTVVRTVFSTVVMAVCSDVDELVDGTIYWAVGTAVDGAVFSARSAVGTAFVRAIRSAVENE